MTALKPTFTEYNPLFPRPTPVGPSPGISTTVEAPPITPGQPTGEVTLEVTLRRPSGKALQKWSPVAHAAAAAQGLVEEVDWNRAVLKHPGDVERVYGLGTAEAMVKKVRGVESLFLLSPTLLFPSGVVLV